MEIFGSTMFSIFMFLYIVQLGASSSICKERDDFYGRYTCNGNTKSCRTGWTDVSKECLVTCTKFESHESKVDCGHGSINEQECREKGCCWESVKIENKNIPWCYNGIYVPPPVLPTPSSILVSSETSPSMGISVSLELKHSTTMISEVKTVLTSSETTTTTERISTISRIEILPSRSIQFQQTSQTTSATPQSKIVIEMSSVDSSAMDLATELPSFSSLVNIKHSTQIGITKTSRFTTTAIKPSVQSGASSSICKERDDFYGRYICNGNTKSCRTGWTDVSKECLVTCIKFESHESKVDCGHGSINEQECRKKGCCWESVKIEHKNIPWCYNGTYVPPPALPTSSSRLVSSEILSSVRISVSLELKPSTIMDAEVKTVLTSPETTTTLMTVVKPSLSVKVAASTSTSMLITTTTKLTEKTEEAITTTTTITKMTTTTLPILVSDKKTSNNFDTFNKTSLAAVLSLAALATFFIILCLILFRKNLSAKKKLLELLHSNSFYKEKLESHYTDNDNDKSKNLYTTINVMTQKPKQNEEMSFENPTYDIECT